MQEKHNSSQKVQKEVKKQKTNYKKRRELMSKGMVSQDVSPQAWDQSKFKLITIERSKQLVSRTIHVLKHTLIMLPTYAPHQALLY